MTAPEDPESAEETLIARDRARDTGDTGGDGQGGDRLMQWIAEQHEEGQ